MDHHREKTDIVFTISGRLLASCAVAYMALPTILFLLGWVRPLFSIPVAMAVTASSVLLCVKLPASPLHFTRRQLAVYLGALLLSLLCLLVSPIGSVGLLVFIAIRALVFKTPVRQYFSSWTVLAGGALVLLAGIYFMSSNGNNRIRLTWEDSPFDLLRHGGWKFWDALAGSWLLTVGVPAVLLFRRFKKDALFWSALVILTLTYFIYIGSVGGYNEFYYKAPSISFFCLVLLFTRVFMEHLGTRPWRILCIRYLALAALPSLSVFAKAAPAFAFTESARLSNMQRLWQGHLHHPEHPWNAPLWGKGEGAAFRTIYFQQAGQSADGPLRPFSTGTGTGTDTDPATVRTARP